MFKNPHAHHLSSYYIRAIHAEYRGMHECGRKHIMPTVGDSVCGFWAIRPDQGH